MSRKTSANAKIYAQRRKLRVGRTESVRAFTGEDLAEMGEEYKAFLKALGSRIRELRRQRGWSNRDMLLTHRVNDSQWRKYERGGGMTLESMLGVAKIFEISLAELLDGLQDFPVRSVAEIQAKTPSKKRAPLSAPTRSSQKT